MGEEYIPLFLLFIVLGPIIFLVFAIWIGRLLYKYYKK
jgi:hypothetical protein